MKNHKGKANTRTRTNIPDMLNSIRCFTRGICSQSQEEKRRLMTGSPMLMKTIPNNKTTLISREPKQKGLGVKDTHDYALCPIF